MFERKKLVELLFFGLVVCRGELTVPHPNLSRYRLDNLEF